MLLIGLKKTLFEADMIRYTSINYPQMYRSLWVVCQLFLIDGDFADCGRRRSCHLWSSLSLAVLALAVLIILVLVFIVLIPLPPPLLHVVGDVLRVFNPAPAGMISLAGGTERTSGGLTKEESIKRFR